MKEVITKEQQGKYFLAKLVKGTTSTFNDLQLWIKDLNDELVELKSAEYTITQYIQELTLIERWIKENK